MTMLPYVGAQASAPASKPVKDWMSRKEAAAYLTRIGYPIAPKTLANMAANNNAGNGPAYLRARWRVVQYRRADLDLWVNREMVRVG
jgi:hypothetical protein